MDGVIVMSCQQKGGVARDMKILDAGWLVSHFNLVH